jgi:hypothetical protein
VRSHRLRPHERALAWLITGPVGHLVAGVIDLLAMIARLLWARARGRELG